METMSTVLSHEKKKEEYSWLEDELIALMGLPAPNSISSAQSLEADYLVNFKKKFISSIWRNSWNECKARDPGLVIEQEPGQRQRLGQSSRYYSTTEIAPSSEYAPHISILLFPWVNIHVIGERVWFD